MEARDAELAVRLWDLSEALVGGILNWGPPGDKSVEEVVGQYGDTAIATKPTVMNSSDDFF
jgi:hypothetical protein